MTVVQELKNIRGVLTQKKKDIDKALEKAEELIDLTKGLESATKAAKEVTQAERKVRAKKATKASAASASDSGDKRGRGQRNWSEDQRKATAERMKKYWADRKKGKASEASVTS